MRKLLSKKRAVRQKQKRVESGYYPKSIEIVENAGQSIAEINSQGIFSGICISTAGMVDCKQGKILYSAEFILHYTGTEIKKTLENRFHVPCSVENDVNCAGLAELVSGAAKGFRNVEKCLTVGTGNPRMYQF